VVDWLTDITADCPKSTKAYHWRIRRIRSEAANFSLSREDSHGMVQPENIDSGH